jgi:hypothetical protein
LNRGQTVGRKHEKKSVLKFGSNCSFQAKRNSKIKPQGVDLLQLLETGSNMS